MISLACQCFFLPPDDVRTPWTFNMDSEHDGMENVFES